MRTIFDTKTVRPSDAFDQWCSLVYERIAPLEISTVGDAPFEGSIEAAHIGHTPIAQVTSSATRTILTRKELEKQGNQSTAVIAIMLSGVSKFARNDREAIQRPGDIIVLDRRPGSSETSPNSKAIFIEVPLDRLENYLGPLKLYSTVNIDAGLASARVTSSFFSSLVQVHESMSGDTANRMSSIGLDLIIACLAERISHGIPENTYGNLVVQRAKFYIEENLHNPKLDPSLIATEVGVSVRRLQQLFRERGRQIAEYIWSRRLEVAALQLSNPAYALVSLNVIAYRIGFSDQAHFSRRFKSHYGVTPSEYRFSAHIRPE